MWEIGDTRGRGEVESSSGGAEASPFAGRACNNQHNEKHDQQYFVTIALIKCAE